MTINRSPSGRRRPVQRAGTGAVGLAAVVASALATTALAQQRAEEAAEAADSGSMLAMPTETMALDEITVTSATAAGYAVDPQNAPATISVVSGEELRNRSYRDVTAALRDIPGLYVDSGPSGKGGTGEISIRGFDPKYTLLLVDGVPQSSRQAYYNGFGSGAEFGWLPPISSIERIEVIRGPMSTIYGSDALGGVINVITKPVADEWTGTVSVDALVQEDSDSGNRQQTDFRVAGPLVADRLSLSIDGSYLQREEDNIENGYPQYRRRNLNGELSWAVTDDQRLSLEIGEGRQTTEGNVFLTGTDREFETQRRRQTLRHLVDWTDRMTTRSYVQRTELEQDDGSFNSTYERITANTQTVIPIGDHLITLGTQFRNQDIENPDRGLGERNLSRYEIAPYVEHEWFITEAFSLTSGLRYVYDEEYGDHLVPRAYGVYRLTDTLTAKGGVSAGYRTPDLKEGTDAWIEGGGGPNCPGCRDVGNSDLEPEESVTYEAGLDWRSQQGYAATLTVYHTDYDQKIEKPIICDSRDGQVVGNPPCVFGDQEYTAIYQYTNVDKAEITGVEVTGEAALTDRLSLNASYAYTDSEILTGANQGFPLSDQPKNRASLGLDYLLDDRTTLWSDARYTGETEQILGRGGLSEQYPDYTIVDAGATHALTDELTLYGGVYNLLDKDIDFAEYGRLLDGRRYNVGARLDF